MYNDLFSIGPVTVHSYGVFTAIALMAALILACSRAKKRGLSDDICYGILFVGVIFGYLCSKLTFVLVEFDSFIKDPKMFLSQSGFVVIGGLIGGILSAWVYCKIKKVEFIDYFDLCAPSIAIAQGFGRIGCFMAGCCYGRETKSCIGIAFTHSDYAPNGVKLIPTQLISSGLDFLNMAFLLILAKKTKKKGIVSAAYVIAYSIGRFFVEMLRDDERGTVGIFSTSQFFSIVSLIVGAIYLFLVVKFQDKLVKKETEEPSEEKNEEV
ncbi:MAG: prolipoprotein diacylglyceryl transferase [Lachnospiraceae bacterium]|nr:prolipoprotein diacylglyceryl transferase [Lachnospiraceae bacterium]